jgi:hypothetical protein
MKHPASALFAALALLGGCTVTRGDREFMLQTERERRQARQPRSLMR